MTAIATVTATHPFAVKQRRAEHAAAVSSKEFITSTAIVNRVASNRKQVEMQLLQGVAIMFLIKTRNHNQQK